MSTRAYCLSLGVALLLTALGCAGIGGPEAEAPTTSAESLPLPEGFELRTEPHPSGAAAACAGRSCGVWSPATGWLVEPSRAIYEEAGEGILRAFESQRYRYYSLEGRAWLPGGPWQSGSLMQDGRIWVQGPRAEMDGSEHYGGYLLLDTEGLVLRDFGDELHRVGGLAEGLFPATRSGDFLSGYLDRDGAWVIPPRFANAGDFVDGAAQVATPDGRRFRIDRRGREL